MKFERNSEEVDAPRELSRKAKIVRVAATVVAVSLAMFAASHIEPTEAQQTRDEQIEEQYETCLDHMLSKEDVAVAHKESFGPFAHDLPDKPENVLEAMRGCYAFAQAIVDPMP